MTRAVSIRELRSDEELLGCISLLRAAFGTVAREFGLTEESAPTHAAFATQENLRRHLDDGMTLYGMFREGAQVGSVAVKKAKRKDGVFFIERLAVDPRERHRGYGARLLQFACARIRDGGGTTASVGLMDNNERLKSWYRTKGFVRNDCRRVAHLPFRVCFMTRDLSENERVLNGARLGGARPGPAGTGVSQEW